MLNFDVKRKINTLRDILVGKVPDPKAQVEQITIALIYKFMDDMDLEGVEFGGSRQFFKEDYEKYAWSNIMQSEYSGQQRANLYGEGIDKMSMNPHSPQLFRDIFRGAYVPYRDAETLNMFLKEINDFNYDHSEDLGNAFELLLSIMGSQGDAGQFRTPRHIIDMIVEIVDPQKTDSILDPACGTAGFLISSYKHILNNNKDKDEYITLSADERKRMTESFAGYDISPDMVRLSRVNMYLHNFTKPQISEYDTLSSVDKWDETYDVILANPPFMTPKGGINPHKRYRIDAKRSEVLFVDYIAEHLNPTGKAGIIVPEGIVFQSGNAYKSLRKYLVEDDLLYAVISLPAGVFNPYSGVKTSILLLDKTLAKQKDDILFVKINNDGYDLGAQRRKLNDSDIPEIIQIVKDYQTGLDVSDNAIVTIAPKKDISEQDYILVGERYKETVAISCSYPMVELGAICEIITGYAFKSESLLSEMIANSLPVIKIGNLNNKSVLDIANVQYFPYDKSLEKYLIKEKDILLAMTGATVGKVSVSGSDNLLLNQRVANIKAKIDRIKPEYLMYLLFDERFYNYCQANAGGGAQGNISPAEIKSYKIPLPPLNIQEEIVKEIQGYQKIIDGAKQILENYKPTIKIDPSWEMGKLGEVCELQSGGTPLKNNPAYWNRQYIPWYTSGELNELYTSDPNDYISKLGLKESSAKLFEKGSLLIGMYDTAAFKMSLLDRDAAFNQAICGIKPNENINMVFLYLFLSHNREIYMKQRMGARQRNLTKSFISEIQIPIVPINIQNEIAKLFFEELNIINQNKKLINIYEKKIKDRISEVWSQ